MALGNYMQPIGIILMFFLILFGAYWTSRYAAKFQSGRTLGRNMTIIEAISVGPQKTLQIVRVGKTYMVVGVSRDRITLVREMDASELNIPEGESSVPFGSILEKIVRRQKGGQSHTEIGEEQNEPFEKN